MDRIVIFPRYTSLVGAAAAVTYPVHSPPIDARAYAEVVLTAWRGKGFGGILDVEFVLEQSADLDLWHSGAPFSPASADAETSVVQEIAFPWVRLRVSFSGAGAPAVPVWLVGEFVRREGMRAGEVA